MHGTAIGARTEKLPVHQHRWRVREGARENRITVELLTTEPSYLSTSRSVAGGRASSYGVVTLGAEGISKWFVPHGDA